jgi:hypothetical protein
MEVRQLGISSLETVLDVWHAANELSALTNHRSNLREWARQEGARIFGAFDGEQIVGTAFSLLTRVDDGAGEVVAGAPISQGWRYSPLTAGAESVRRCCRLSSRMLRVRVFLGSVCGRTRTTSRRDGCSKRPASDRPVAAPSTQSARR